MSKQLAWFFSILLHPSLILCYSVIFLFKYCYTIISLAPENIWVVFGVTFVLSVVMPYSAVFLLLNTGVIKNWHLARRKDRVVPLLVTGICQGVLTYMFLQHVTMHNMLVVLTSTSVLLSVFAIFVTFFYKISLHAMGVGSLLGMFIALQLKFAEFDLLLPFLVALILGGVVLSSRLKLKAHGLDELISGCVSGLVLTGGYFYLML